ADISTLRPGRRVKIGIEIADCPQGYVMESVWAEVIAVNGDGTFSVELADTPRIVSPNNARAGMPLTIEARHIDYTERTDPNLRREIARGEAAAQEMALRQARIREIEANEGNPDA